MPPPIFMPKEKGRIVEVTFSQTVERNDNGKTWNKVELKSTVGESEEAEDVYEYLRETAEYLLHK